MTSLYHLVYLDDDRLHYISRGMIASLTSICRFNLESVLVDVFIDSGNISDIRASGLIVGIFKEKELDGNIMGHLLEAVGDDIRNLVKSGEISGALDNVAVIYTLGMMEVPRVIFCGLGAKDLYGEETLRRSVAVGLRKLRALGCDSVALDVESFAGGNVDISTVIKGGVEGALMGLYRYEDFKTNRSRQNLESLALFVDDSANEDSLQNQLNEGITVAESVNLSRDFSNSPPNVMTPTKLAESAIEISNKTDIICDVLDGDDMSRMGMGAIMGVARGSAEPPKLIVMKYFGDRDRDGTELALVGKGITFDSGGLNLKSYRGMRAMKGDMAGGAAVIAAMKAISELSLKANVIGVIPATENMPGQRAQRPGDVVRVMDGTTIEIDNTDAEGRLILADAVCYAVSLGAEAVIDVATLTGAVGTALGDRFMGVFGNKNEFTKLVMEAGNNCGERLWELPTCEEYAVQFKSDIADIKNAGTGGAGASIGAMIIGRFAADIPWVHVDIAGTSRVLSTEGYKIRGATGIAVRTLIEVAKYIKGLGSPV